MRIYLSHGSMDQARARRLVEALVRSGIEVRSPDSVADDAADLERQILACEYVVILVSPQTEAHRVRTAAIDIALRRGFGDGRLLVVSVQGFASMEVAARRVLSRVEGRAARPPCSRGHLPIVARTVRELDAVADARGLAAGDFEGLIDVLDHAERHHAGRAFGEAALTLRHAEATLARALPRYRPYYLVIAQCVCDLHLGLDVVAGMRLRELEGHPLRDESWFATMAVVALRGGRDAEARMHIRGALAESRIRGGAGLDVLAQLCPLEPDYDGGDRLDDDAWRRARAARSLIAGRPELAVVELHGLPITWHTDRSILLLARAYMALESWSAAVVCLEMYIAATPPTATSPSIARQLARCYTAVGALERAAEVLREHGN